MKADDLHPLQDDERGLSQKEVRVRRCMRDIKNSLERWGCRLDISVTINSRGVLPHMDVVPVEDFKPPGGGDR